MKTKRWPIVWVGMVVMVLFAMVAVATPRGIDPDRIGTRVAAGDLTARHADDDDDDDGDVRSCSKSAKAVSKSCRDGVKADFWLAVANCLNMSDEDAIEECREEAGEDIEEEQEECGDQHEAA